VRRDHTAACAIIKIAFYFFVVGKNGKKQELRLSFLKVLSADIRRTDKQ